MWNPAAALRGTGAIGRLTRWRAHVGRGRTALALLLEALRAAWGRNGVWAPGILLMRNLSLRAKAGVLTAAFAGALLALITPLVWHARADLRSAGDDVAALRATQAAVALEHALHAAPSAAPAASAVAAAMDRLHASLHEGDRWAQPELLKPTWDELQARRDRLAAAAPARRAQAAAELLAAVRTLRSALVARWLPRLDHHRRAPHGRHGLAGVDPRVTLDAADLLHRLTLASAPLLQPGAADDPAVLALALEARARLAVAEPHLDQLVRQGALDRAPTAAAERQATAFLESAARLARSPAHWQAHPVGDAAADPAAAFTHQGRQAVDALATASSRLLQAMADCLAEEQAELTSHLQWLAATVLLAVLACCYVVASTFMVLAGGVRALRQHCVNLAEGNLSGRPRGWGRDEVGEALTHLGQATTRMSHLLSAMTQGVSGVSLASREVATGNAGLTGRTDDIRQAIVSVRERTEGLSQAMAAAATGVGEAAQHVRAMRLNAQRSHKAVTTLRGHMRSLRNKSREVNHVVGMVETVAHQTKLLSLNASVEAARAGAAGKAFAIVAQDVRALALRTEDAARRIQHIIGSSVDEIQEGNLVADRASDAVEATDEGIEAVHTLMGDVVGLTSGAMDEAQQVLGLTRSVEDAVSGSARAVDQLQRASAALREQGDSLKLSVQHFVLS